VKIWGSTFQNLETFGKEVRALETLSQEAREKKLLDSYLKDYMSAEVKAVVGKAMAESQTIAEFEAELKAIDSDHARNTLKVIENYRNSILAQALRPPAITDWHPPTEEELQNAVTELKDIHSGRFSSSLSLLSLQRPKEVADYLMTWENPRKQWSDTNFGYAMASYFCHTCPAAGRKEMLSWLTGAKDEEVRVAAAVYLAFDDVEAGKSKLKEFCALDGDPGAWAAVTLARRGDATALERAMKVFDAPGKDNMEGVPHRNLQKQMLVLLSNSAAASGVPQPPSSVSGKGVYEGIREWYRANGGKLKLVDKWGDELAKQRVD
jgi:hypothetical protein